MESGLQFEEKGTQGKRQNNRGEKKKQQTRRKYNQVSMRPEERRIFERDAEICDLKLQLHTMERSRRQKTLALLELNESRIQRDAARQAYFAANFKSEAQLREEALQRHRDYIQTCLLGLQESEDLERDLLEQEESYSSKIFHQTQRLVFHGLTVQFVTQYYAKEEHQKQLQREEAERQRQARQQRLERAVAEEEVVRKSITKASLEEYHVFDRMHARKVAEWAETALRLQQQQQQQQRQQELQKWKKEKEESPQRTHRKRKAKKMGGGGEGNREDHEKVVGCEGGADDYSNEEEEVEEEEEEEVDDVRQAEEALQQVEHRLQLRLQQLTAEK